jgi:hypothetical protein
MALATPTIKAIVSVDNWQLTAGELDCIVMPPASMKVGGSSESGFG